VHPLFADQVALLLGLTRQQFRRVLRARLHVLVEPGETGLPVGSQLTDQEEWALRGQIGAQSYRTASGPAGVGTLLEALSLYRLPARPPAGPRLRLVDSIIRADPINPDGFARRLFLRGVPVLPPQARAERCRWLNIGYAGMVDRARRYVHLVELSAPEEII